MNKPICAGEHFIKHDQYYYVINPEGGYGMPELLCCEDCIKKPEYKHLRKRMVDAGAKELEEC